MNKKIVFVFISLVFVCLLSTSMVFAADNSTEAVDDNLGADNADSTATVDLSSNTGTIDDFKNDLIESDYNLSVKRNYEFTVGPDSKYADNGIVINNSIIFIEGNNYTVNMNSLASLFGIHNSNVTINNLNIRNTKNNAIVVTNSNLYLKHQSHQTLT